MEHLDVILIVAAAALAAVVAGLKVWAPFSKNTTDDKILEGAEKAKDVVDGVRAMTKK